VRRSAADAERTRQAILAAARSSFAEHGFAAASTIAIARAAGVTRGAVYHHFAGKADLFREVFVEIEHELNETVVAAPRPTASRRSSPGVRPGSTSPSDPTTSASPSWRPRPCSARPSGMRSTPASGSSAWKPG
jgi:AcrR family transcriptional regulator